MSYLAAWKSHTGPSPLSWGAIQFVGLGPERPTARVDEVNPVEPGDLNWSEV
jgi:hypothetical protein